MVEINKRKKKIRSEAKKNENGVPQGSILGPILFTIFLNDFGKIIAKEDESLINFANDSTLVVGGVNKTDM